ncbi:unnamed protein product [Chondrus crispus]|uniref:Uncharacterized protein n=1 Tax=Chondrus crispus TaxID=2769 RepID=R7QBB7_CHOCR|nr:unnamed protein product [Chondrus crispus]CDF35048.1 unnamed protein product [Chondrus crispus]|eukprot:XP_005714867.1 unnamed protein product [Chondrus crispus]
MVMCNFRHTSHCGFPPVLVLSGVKPNVRLCGAEVSAEKLVVYSGVGMPLPLHIRADSKRGMVCCKTWVWGGAAADGFVNAFELGMIFS